MLTRMQNMLSGVVFRNQILLIAIAGVVSWLRGNFTPEAIGFTWSLLGLVALVLAILTEFGGRPAMHTPKYRTMLVLHNNIDIPPVPSENAQIAGRSISPGTLTGLIAIIGGTLLVFLSG